MKPVTRVRAAVGVLILLLSSSLAAAKEQKDPNKALHNEVVVVPVGDHSISVLVSYLPGETRFTHAIALFPGSPGQGNLRTEDGEIKYDKQRGNFLVRARRHFLEPGILTVVVDAPSDKQRGLFLHSFRASDRYGQDLKAVVGAIGKRYGKLDWTFVGHSEGVVSATHAARMVGPPVKRVVLTASLTSENYQGNGIDADDVKKVGMPVLWVHHKDDPCDFTPYYNAKKYARESGSPLMTVSGAKNRRGDACKPFTEHGFAGMEAETAKGILAWIRTGQAPETISE